MGGSWGVPSWDREGEAGVRELESSEHDEPRRGTPQRMVANAVHGTKGHLGLIPGGGPTPAEAG